MIALGSVDKLTDLNLKGYNCSIFFNKIPPPHFFYKKNIGFPGPLIWIDFFAIGSKQWFQQMTMKLYIWMPGNQK